jgi:hypothetical protein
MKRMVGALVLAAAMVLVPSASAAPPSHHIPGHTDIGGSRSKKGVSIKLIGADTLRQWSADLVLHQAKGPWYEYDSVSPCGGFPGRPNSDNLCMRAVVMCQGPTSGGMGPAVAIFRRELDAAGRPQPGPAGIWSPRGITCFPELVPGAGRPLTMAMIRDAFHDTDFAVPTVNIQPEGDVTLVNLPTFFEVKFPAAGYGPNEVDTPDPARLLGYHIEVRPRLKSITYHLGATTIGPTTSLGGPHPSGDIRATYTRPGSHQVRADIVYTGQFRVGGSQWFDIPGDVDLQGTPVTLTVREATSRLYTH